MSEGVREYFYRNAIKHESKMRTEQKRWGDKLED
jgi:hypothetical protein